MFPFCSEQVAAAVFLRSDFVILLNTQLRFSLASLGDGSREQRVLGGQVTRRRGGGGGVIDAGRLRHTKICVAPICMQMKGALSLCRLRLILSFSVCVCVCVCVGGVCMSWFAA